MWALDKENTTAENVRQFDEILNPKTRIKTKKINRNETTKLSSHSKPNGILFCLLRTYWFYLSLMAILKLALSFLPYVNPTVLDWIIAYMSVDSQEPDWRGFLYAIIMFISPIIESLITTQYSAGIGTIALRMRSCLINSIYKKVSFAIRFL
jgi:ATP-binding cassette subfamily C (CFTR/MRP) protein 1